MTLVLSYADADRLIHVADQRITLTAPDGTESVLDDESIKATHIRGSMAVSFSGLAELDYGRETLDWVAKRLESSPDSFEKTLTALANDLPSATRQNLRGEPLDLRMTGVANHPDGMLIVSGRVTNVSFGKVMQHFIATPEHVRLRAHQRYGAHGVTLSATVRSRLDASIDFTLPTIDIVNEFLWAIRYTHAETQYVGPTAVAVVLPTSVMSGAQPGMWLTASQDSEGRLVEGVIATARAPEHIAKFELVRLKTQ
jgi:hypothetical protein